jgi:hypothetical protein
MSHATQPGQSEYPMVIGSVDAVDVEFDAAVDEVDG